MTNTDLFGDTFAPDPIKKKSKRAAEIYHEQLTKLYGQRPANRCKSCIHFVRHHQSKSWFKCANAPQTNGLGTDWRTNWVACGLFVKK